MPKPKPCTEMMQPGVLRGIVIRFSAFWAAVWLLQWAVAPTWLVGTRAGLQSLVQVVPVTMIAVFVFIVGSTLVIAQLSVGAYGTRAPLMMLNDKLILRLVVSSLGVSIATVALAGLVPDSGRPAHWVTAAVATAALAAVFVLVSTAVTVPAAVLQYTAPVSFAKLVGDGAEAMLCAGRTGLVVFRVGLLGEMMRAANRRGDSVSLYAALQALEALHTGYLRAVKVAPSAGRHTWDTGLPDDAWMGNEVRGALVRAGVDTLRLGGPDEDSDAVASTLGRCLRASIQAGRHHDAIPMIEGLIQMGTTVHQVSATTVNLYAKPAEWLAVAEAAAEGQNDEEIAAQCLAAWILLMSYATQHLRLTLHPLWCAGINDLGSTPPWRSTATIIRDSAWQGKWVHKLPGGPMPTLFWLAAAYIDHASHSPSNQGTPPEGPTDEA